MLNVEYDLFTRVRAKNGVEKKVLKKLLGSQYLLNYRCYPRFVC